VLLAYIETALGRIPKQIFQRGWIQIRDIFICDLFGRFKVFLARMIFNEYLLYNKNYIYLFNSKFNQIHQIIFKMEGRMTKRL
jgi:hypothetical protein